MQDESEEARFQLLRLLREHSYQEAPPGKPFRLASGATSTYFIDVKQTALRALPMNVLGAVLLKRVQTAFPKAKAVAGVALGGCPLATTVSTRSAFWHTTERQLDALYVRKEPKDHGTEKLVEGPLRPGLPVVLLEDVVTSGGSSLKAVEALREADCNVLGIVAVVDRQQGGPTAFAKAGVPFQAIFKVSELRGEEHGTRDEGARSDTREQGTG